MTDDTLLQQIAAKKAELDRLRLQAPHGLDNLNQSHDIELTYTSNAIEGNTLSLKETALVLQGLTIDKKPIKDHLEAIQHRDAFYAVCDMVSKKVKLDESVIKQIHSIILNDMPVDRGIYRRVAVRILGAIHLPPNPVKIPDLMSELLTWYKKSRENLIKKTAIFHIQFERIHPFIDGNGRTGRLITNLELMKGGYPPIDIKFSDRHEYYDCFNEFEQTEKIERLFAEYVLERIEEYLRIIE